MVDSASRLKLFRKVKTGGAPAAGITMLGVTSAVSETAAGSLMNASLGAVSGGVTDVSQASAPARDTLVHPAGRADATTPSKFSVVRVLERPVARFQVTLPRFVAPSWTWSVAVTGVPQATAPTVNVKLRHTAAPPATIAP